MKHLKYLLLPAIALIFLSFNAYADDKDFAYKGVDEFATVTAAPAAGDAILFYDVSARKAVKQDASDINLAALGLTNALTTTANVGTAGTNVVATEYGDGYNHITVLTLTGAALTPTIPADAEGAGAIIYTFPAGVHITTACHMDVTAVVADTATNAVDMGLGSLIGSGDIATLTTAAMEDCVTGQTVADISSPATEKSTISTAGAPLLFEAGGSKVLHLNMAGTWNATVASLAATGTVTIYWTYLGS